MAIRFKWSNRSNIPFDPDSSWPSAPMQTCAAHVTGDDGARLTGTTGSTRKWEAGFRRGRTGYVPVVTGCYPAPPRRADMP